MKSEQIDYLFSELSFFILGNRFINVPILYIKSKNSFGAELGF